MPPRCDEHATPLHLPRCHDAPCCGRRCIAHDPRNGAITMCAPTVAATIHGAEPALPRRPASNRHWPASLQDVQPCHCQVARRVTCGDTAARDPSVRTTSLRCAPLCDMSPRCMASPHATSPRRNPLAITSGYPAMAATSTRRATLPYRRGARACPAHHNADYRHAATLRDCEPSAILPHHATPPAPVPLLVISEMILCIKYIINLISF